MALLYLGVLFITSINYYVSCESGYATNPSCAENCSWTSYDTDHMTMINECHRTNVDHLAGYDCPNTYGITTAIYVSTVNIISVTFNSISARGSESTSGYSSMTDDEITTLCANISFTVNRGGLSTMKAIRFTAMSTSYEDEGRVYCQLWTFPTELNSCSFSEGDCLPDIDMERVLFHDCFCNIAPGPGTLEVSVDVLPKPKQASQVMQSFLLPSCDRSDLENNKHCSLTENERWRPVHSSTKQLCPISSKSINVTFDLAPEQYGIQEYYIFLYKAKDSTCGTDGQIPRELIVNKTSTPIFEQTFKNESVNMTTVSFQDLELNTYYIAAVRIKDHPPKGADYIYSSHHLCQTSIHLQETPCNNNSCPDGEVCVANCLDYRCDCGNKLTRVGKECLNRWQPLSRIKQVCSGSESMDVTVDLAPEQYGYREYSVFLYKTASKNKCAPDGTVVMNKTIAGKTINATIISFDYLDWDAHYIVGIKVKDKPPYGEADYQTHFFCDTIHGNQKCSVWWKNYAWIGSVALFAVLSCAIVAVLVWRGRRRLRSSDNSRAGSTSGSEGGYEVELPESPTNGPFNPRAIRLICNSNWLLQDFADKLRDILQRRLNCHVSLETLWDTGHVKKSNWITEAAKKRTLVCFIWDRNLAILDDVTTPMTHQVIEALPKSQSERAVILQFDFTPPDGLPPECRSFKLPSGLTDLVKEFNGEVNEDDLDILGCAYVDVINSLRKRFCLRSKERWDLPQRPNSDVGDDSDDDDDNESLVSIGDISMEDVDADDAILVPVLPNE